MTPASFRRRGHRWRMVAACLAVVLLAIVAASAAVPASGRAVPKEIGPRTVARVSGAVYAVAQSATAQAWRLCNRVDVRMLAGKAYPPIPAPASGASRCHEVTGLSRGSDGDPISRDVLVLAGPTVAWSSVAYGNDTEDVVFPAIAFATGRPVPEFLPAVWADSYQGWHLAGPVSDGHSVVFAATRLDWDDACGYELDPSCRHLGSAWISITDGRQKPRRVTAAAATLVAVAGKRVAFVPGRVNDGSRQGERLSPERRVKLLTSAGTQLGSVSTVGYPAELALSPTLGAVLEERLIEWFDPRTFRSGGSISVSPDAHALGVSGRQIVWASGGRIFTLIPGASKHVIATVNPGTVLIGPNLTSNRLLWAEYDNTRRQSRLKTLTLR